MTKIKPETEEFRALIPSCSDKTTVKSALVFVLFTLKTTHFPFCKILLSCQVKISRVFLYNKGKLTSKKLFLFWRIFQWKRELFSLNTSKHLRKKSSFFLVRTINQFDEKDKGEAYSDFATFWCSMFKLKLETAALLSILFKLSPKWRHFQVLVRCKKQSLNFVFNFRLTQVESFLSREEKKNS